MSAVVALLIEAGEVAAVRKLKSLTGEATLHAHLIVAVFLQIAVTVIAPHIGHVFPEQHHQDVVLVVGRIDDTSECVARAPCYIVDFGLVDFAHRKVLFESVGIHGNEELFVGVSRFQLKETLGEFAFLAGKFSDLSDL